MIHFMELCMDKELENIRLKKHLFYTQMQLVQYMIKEIEQQEQIYLAQQGEQDGGQTNRG
jgi:hypothetical protein